MAKPSRIKLTCLPRKKLVLSESYFVMLPEALNTATNEIATSKKIIVQIKFGLNILFLIAVISCIIIH